MTFFPRPLNVKTRFETGSYRIASGFSPVTLIVAVTASEGSSKTVTVFARPLLVKPFLRSGASAMPWTPSVPGMSPTTFPESASTTITCVPREMNTRRDAASRVR